MRSKTLKKTKMVRPWIIVVASILLLPAILDGLYYTWDQINYLRLREEIKQVAAQSKLQPIATECHLAMDPVCVATYPRMSYAEQVSMLRKSGYEIWTPTLGPDATSVDASSPRSSIYASANYDDSNQTRINYRFE